jgi:hypothetical protein
MDDRINVTVHKNRQRATFFVGRLGGGYEIEVDLTDTNNLANTLVEIANIGDQLIQAQVVDLAKRVEALEKKSGESGKTATA